MDNRRKTTYIVLAVILFLMMAGVAIFLLGQNSNKDDADVDLTDNTEVAVETERDKPVEKEVEKETDVRVADLPEGWVIRENESPKLSFAVPEGERVAFNINRVGGMIDVGYGAPVAVSYSQSEGWQTYSNDDNNQPTIKGENIVMPLTSKAEGSYPASYYNTGDGTGSESRVLVVANDKIYQFEFTGKLQNEEFMNQFVSFLKID